MTPMDRFNAIAMPDSLALVFNANRTNVFSERIIATWTQCAPTHSGRFNAHAIGDTMEMDCRARKSMSVLSARTIVTHGGRNAKTPWDPFDAHAILAILVTASRASMWTNVGLDSTTATLLRGAQTMLVPFGARATVPSVGME